MSYTEGDIVIDGVKIHYYRTGKGDCEDLAAAKVAEYRERGIPANIRLTRRGRIWHVTVRLPNGMTEDPSKRLGMRGAA